MRKVVINTRGERTEIIHTKHTNSATNLLPTNTRHDIQHTPTYRRVDPTLEYIQYIAKKTKNNTHISVTQSLAHNKVAKTTVHSDA